jgi:hypothetical protein
VGISLAKIPVIAKIEEALSTMDTKILNRSQIGALLRGN